jgi:hypothetical protein
MKRNTIYLSIVIFTTLINNYSNAQITKAPTETKVEIKNDSLTSKLTREKIISHLITRMSLNKVIRNSKVNKIIENMEFNKMYVEGLSKGVKLIIIPLKSVYFSQNIDLTKPKPMQFVLIYEREKELISRSDFMLVFPKDKSLTKMPKNAFHDYQFQKSTQIDGTYTLVNFADIKQVELDVENGKRKQLRVWSSKNNFNNTGSDDCTEWTLETTVINDDGTTTKKKENLGKTCTECPPGFICDSVKK